MFPPPPLFKLIKEQSETEWSEMHKVFNMGHRMELYIPENIAESIINISGSFNIEAKIAMIAITTNNSIKVKPNCRSREYDLRLRDFIWKTDKDGMSWKQVKPRLKIVVV
jgi:hypothetical protein